MSLTTRILVTGGDGILAQALRPFFPFGTFLGRGECDVTNPNQVRSVFNEVKPEIVIHCAACTAHNAEPMAYVMANVVGTVHVVVASRKAGARFVYPSTDYLGAKHECDPVRPINAYAASKYAGEIVVGSATPGLVVRGSWYSHPTYSHAATDAFTSRLPVDKAAYYMATLAVSTETGIWNIGGQRQSVYEIALAYNPRVAPISRHQLQLPYEVPADSSLDTEKLTRWLSHQ